MSETVGFEISRQQREAIERTAVESFDSVRLSAPLPDGVDAGVVRQRVEQFVARHEALRTSLRHAAGLQLPLQHVSASPMIGSGGPAALNVENGPVLTADIQERTLLLSAHPAVADVATLVQLAAAVHGAPPQADDPIQYAEYAAWQAEQQSADSADAQAAEAAWQRIVGGDDPTTLPVQGPWAGAESASITPATPFSPDQWLAAWALTVARLAAQKVVTIGVELDPRRDEELVGAVGAYTVVRPMQIGLPLDGTVQELTADVARLGELAAVWVEWAPDTQRCPVLFGIGPEGSRAAREAFQLELRVAADGSAAEVVAGPDATEAAARNAATALSTVLTSFEPDTALRDIDVITASAARSLLGPPPQPASRGHVLDLVLQAAHRHPDRQALTDGTSGVTYREMVGLVEHLAAALIDAGAGPEAPVALRLPRSVDLLVAMLAAQRCGAGYVALDLDQPATRIARQLDVVASRIVIVADGDQGLPGHVSVPVRPVNGPSTDSVPLPELHGSDRAYVIFTSGSTGVPKGVSVPGRALGNYCAAVLELVGPDDERQRSWGLVTSPATDLGNTAIFPALVSGGTVHIVPTGTVQDPVAFARYQARHRLDILKITPSHLGSLLVDDRSDVLPAEIVFLGGESLPWALVAEIRRRGARRVVNHYGPTETTVGALAQEITETPSDPSGTVPIGHALAGCEALLLDERRRLVPPGTIGELAIGGAGLADGYLGDDAATAQRFVAHPYREGARLYLTGDLGRRLDDGAVAFLGRRDGQIKIRGHRVETGEIEAVLRDHRSVRRAAAVMRESPDSDARLIGYVVAQVNPAPTEDELLAHVAARLPDYMVPARIVVLDSLPLRPNGKLDTDALPLPSSVVTTSVAPQSATEVEVAAIFADLLGVDSVGVTDDFFRLGGHSLLATKVIVSVRSRLGVELPVYSLFEAPTARGIASLADEARLQNVSDDELARMIAELDDLSDEEAAALLAAESRDDDAGDSRA